ncbi:hypothetical protein HNR39_003727 [Glaciimonas immobilis]|uniref:Uncharacterized protein n=1 Tax=Glaciimonas immobilis TaxID=728004 RepID=A0A840RVH5_9BURK|nr:hypothetical protein [Glaciimonas immobilis]
MPSLIKIAHGYKAPHYASVNFIVAELRIYGSISLFFCHYNFLPQFKSGLRKSLSNLANKIQLASWGAVAAARLPLGKIYLISSEMVDGLLVPGTFLNARSAS